MNDTIIGYQYGDNKAYIGVYIFPNNLDKEDIHLPPNTTLIEPPTSLPTGKEASWSGSEWLVRDEDLSWLPPARAQEALPEPILVPSSTSIDSGAIDSIATIVPEVQTQPVVEETTPVIEVITPTV